MSGAATAPPRPTPPLGLSLVVPCYNEAANLLRGVLDTLGAFTEGDPRFAEVIVVDDGSTDVSPKLIAAAARRFPKLALVENRHRARRSPSSPAFDGRGAST